MNGMKKHLFWLLAITILNYIAQIPYALHLYHRILGANPWGAVMLGLTFLMFIIPYILLSRKSPLGYYGMVVFLTVEFIFYLLNFIGSLLRGYPPFFQIANSDRILVFVFLIGYINFLGSGYFLLYFMRNQKIFKPVYE